MDHKTWLWRKKSSEKTISADDKGNLTSKENEQVQALLADKEELEKELTKLNDKLALAFSDSNSKDELVKKQTKIAQEAVAGWEKAEAEVLSIKQDFDEALQQRLLYEERVTHLDGALKECMQQLRFVREEQEQRIHDAVMKASKEFEKARMVLEEQLSETSQRLVKAGAENAHLTKAIIVKENMLEDLKRHMVQAEADYNALMIRLESTEKDNVSFKYEVRVLEKELEIRNDEREFSRRTAEASHRHHLDSVKKIAKLESECQRLRILVQKRLPGPAAFAKMRSEVEMWGRDAVEMRRKKLNSTSLMVESSVDSSPETTVKRINSLTDQLFAVEEENKTLKESLSRKTNELQFSRTMFARTASKLSQLESQLEELTKGQVPVEQPRNVLMSHDFSLASCSDIGSDDKASCAESWASALISELEHFRSGKQKESLSCRSVEASDINLMDDFVEMEKLAVVSVEKGPESSHASSKVANGMNGFLENGSNEIASEAVGKEIIPDMFELSNSNHETCYNDILKGNVPGWLEDVVKVVLEQNHVTHKSHDDILEDIREALRYMNNFDHFEFGSSKGSGHVDASKSLGVDPSSEVTKADIEPVRKSKQQSQSDLSKSLGKIIELIEGISLPARDYDNLDSSCTNIEMPTGYMVRVFQWKTSELSNVLQQFLHVCYDLLNGKADHEKFTQELTTALDWIMNHCFSLQDVSTMRDNIKKQFDWDETRSESEAEIGVISHFADAAKSHLPREQLPCLPPVTNSDGHDEEFKDKLINVEPEKDVLEETLQSGSDKIKSLMNQLQESEKTTTNLRLELETLKECNEVLQDRIQNHQLINENLDAQSTEAELKEAHHKVLALEVELENKSHSCEELEARCLELQLQLESMTKECSIPDTNQKEKPPRTEWEITAASEKLAECQETIFNLGKQLKALATPNDGSLFDKVIAAQCNKTHPTTITVPQKDSMKVKNRASLLDQMLAEDDTKAKDLKAPRAVDGNTIIPVTTTTIPGLSEPLEKILSLKGFKSHDDGSDKVESLDIVPTTQKRGGGSLWKKLVWRKKRSASMKLKRPQ
ncbi:filament-like plant protein 7 isoform X1 [Senna tora]|uniref:Filament-like plant protein 7 isoform X1 n=1 Tax=Senna tora TaxID=362788 RepID=A0A834SU83_9FABA|nr:filament-like plant protein 7 isoform X1 [Senna tora]